MVAVCVHWNALSAWRWIVCQEALHTLESATASEQSTYSVQLLAVAHPALVQFWRATAPSRRGRAARGPWAGCGRAIAVQEDCPLWGWSWKDFASAWHCWDRLCSHWACRQAWAWLWQVALACVCQVMGVGCWDVHIFWAGVQGWAGSHACAGAST